MSDLKARSLILIPTRIQLSLIGPPLNALLARCFSCAAAALSSWLTSFKDSFLRSGDSTSTDVVDVDGDGGDDVVVSDISEARVRIQSG